MKWQTALASLLFAGTAQAAQPGAIPGCLGKGLPAGRPPETALFVAIDQTTALDGRLKQLVADNIRPFLQAGYSFTVVTFSAFTQGHYTTVVTSGILDGQLTQDQRNDIAKPVLQKFDQCMQRQPQLATQLVGAALRNAYAGTSGNIAKSDVLGSLKSIAALVHDSNASQKVVLLVSDMLENSSVTSFYAAGGQAVRTINAADELKLAEKNQLLADFTGARVYVMGAGLLAQDGQSGKAYRDPKTMNALAGFWSAYLGKSNAQLIEFGQPALLRPVR